MGPPAFPRVTPTSHGPESSLILHIAEVALAAKNRWERIALACHDIGKATILWQVYSRGGFTSASPHQHAETGALLAALLLGELGAPERERAKALATVAAHHSNLGRISIMAETSDGAKASRIILHDPQAERFFCETLPATFGYEPAAAIRAWQAARSMFPLRNDDWLWAAPASHATFTPVSSLEAYLECRDFLGRLVAYDHASAAHQSGGPWVDPVLKKREFLRRPARSYPKRGPLNALRSKLRTACVALADKLSPDVCAAICAPTGMGKTEALLALAEALVKAHGLESIVYSLPLTAIIHQLYDEYLSGSHAADALLWNYQRKEKNVREQGRGGSEHEDVWTKVAIHERRFDASYVATTFNQVLLSAGHPGKSSCVAGTELRNAVVILDEIHKLPRPVLVFGLRLLMSFAKQNNLYIVVASATLPPSEMLRLPAKLVTLPDEVCREINTAPSVALRRSYAPFRQKRLTVAGLKAEMDTFHRKNNKSLLVVLNAVAKGTLPLSEMFTGKKRADLRTSIVTDEGRHVFFLDNLVPPYRQAEILSEVRRLLAAGALVTLVTTPLIEAGVDLDFDELWDDFFSLSSLLQRGGRCGRNYRQGRRCRVLCFTLMVESARGLIPSREALLDQSGARRSGVPELLALEDEYAQRAEGMWFDSFEKECAEDKLIAALSSFLVRSSYIDPAPGETALYAFEARDYAGFVSAEEIAAIVDPVAAAEGQTEAVILPLAMREEYLACLAQARCYPNRDSARRLQSLRARYVIRSLNAAAVRDVTEGMSQIDSDDERPVFAPNSIY